MAEDGPPLLRPIPRRPYDVNLTTATPPSDTEASEPPSQDNDSARFLSAAHSLLAGTPSMSRSSSAMNLASSTLYGIYSPTATGKDAVFEGDTPWGTGAQTPSLGGGLDGFSKQGRVLHRRRSSYRSIDSSAHSDPSHTLSPVSLFIRGVILFSLGVGYGFLLARFQDSSPWYTTTRSSADNIIKTASADWKNLAFWGVAGVVWGASMPWLDKLWYETFGEDEDEAGELVAEPDLTASEGSGMATDWALVMRAIGAFVGIVFAIRKLAWTSTLQISLTLALVNPLLWWLIDRSKVGILLSASVGLVGSGLLLGLDPDLMPVPPSSTLAAFTRGFNESLDEEIHSPHVTQDEQHGLIAHQELLETGIWMLSVLFCSCLCFGNIGRRMARDRMAVGRGRWGGVR